MAPPVSPYSRPLPGIPHPGHGGATQGVIQDRRLSVWYTNADGLSNKSEELKERVAEATPDIVAVTETKLSNMITDAIFPEGYQVLRKERAKKGGGGVALLVRNHWQFEEMGGLARGETGDFLAGTIRTGRHKVVVAVIYNPPNNSRRPRQEYDDSNEGTIDAIAELARKAHMSGAKLLILGDFNHGEVDWENWDPHGGPETWRAKLVDVVRENFLFQHVKDTTRERGGDEPARLDLVLSTSASDIETIDHESPLGASDHTVLTFDYLVELDKLGANGGESCEILDFRRGNYAGVREFLSAVQWEREMDGTSPDEMMACLISKCQEAEAAFIPRRRGRLGKNGVSPWFNQSCKKAKAKSKRVWKTYRKHRTAVNREASRRARNEYMMVRREAERQFENDIAAKAKSEPKLLHSHIRRKTTVKDQVLRLKEGGELTRSDKEVCEVLNRRFKEVFTVETGSVPEIQGERVHQQVLDTVHTSREEVKSMLEELDTSKAMGPDKLSPWILKEGAEALAAPLSAIFNRSMGMGELPAVWKTANVVPIYKKGDRQEALNYRPVSLTSIVCKIMEKIIRRRVVDHLEASGFISSNQHGFRAGKSCLTNLLEFYDNVTAVRQERGGWVDCIFLDCKKAFDTVPHKRLVHKLEAQAGITGNVLRWLTEYLSGRKQRVIVRGEMSEWESVTSGVPQGSVLGPVLFLVYVNDLPSGLGSDVSLFADDVKLMRRIQTEEDGARLQRDLDKLQEWSDKWLLEFNPSKCKVMKIGEGAGRPETEYTLGGQRLQFSLREKDLGVSIVPSVSPEAHINRITSAAHARLANIRIAFRNLNKESFLTLYTAYVRPILEYAAPAWNPHLKKHVRKLEKVQRYATRLVPELRGMSYEERLEELQLTSLEDRRTRGDMITTYKILRGFDRVDRDRLFERRETGTRGHGWKLKTQMSHRDVRKYFFSLRVVRKWNELDSEVVEATSIHSFKDRYDRAHAAARESTQ